MDDQESLAAKRFNEQLKALSNLSGNGGMALFIAAAGALYLGKDTGPIGLWLIVGVLVMAGSIVILQYVRPEG